MKRWLLLLAAAAISVTVQSAAAPVVDEAIPATFKHLFAPRKGPVTVDLYGATLTLPGESKFRLMAEKAVRAMPGCFMAETSDGINPGAGYVRMALVHDHVQTEESLVRVAAVYDGERGSAA